MYTYFYLFLGNIHFICFDNKGASRTEMKLSNDLV